MQLLQGRMQELMDEQTRLRQTINDRKTANILLVMSAMPQGGPGGESLVSTAVTEANARRLNALSRDLMRCAPFASDSAGAGGLYPRPQPWLVVALHCDLNGKQQKSLEFVDRAIAVDSKHVAAHQIAGALWLALQQPMEAVRPAATDAPMRPAPLT